MDFKFDMVLIITRKYRCVHGYIVTTVSSKLIFSPILF